MTETERTQLHNHAPLGCATTLSGNPRLKSLNKSGDFSKGTARSWCLFFNTCLIQVHCYLD